jgi:hypothetical protein
MSGLKATDGAALGMRATAAAKWAEWKPMVIGAAVGLIAGPLISGLAGFQVRTSTADAATHSGIVAQQAAFCVERARAGMAPGTVLSDWQARNTLATKYAVMPGATAPNSEVIYACASKLAA